MSDDPKSKINQLRVPDFKSTIPDHFVSKLNDQERYLVQTLSKMEQENAWLIVGMVETNAHAIDLDVRVLVDNDLDEELTIAPVRALRAGDVDADGFDDLGAPAVAEGEDQGQTVVLRERRPGLP